MKSYSFTQWFISFLKFARTCIYIMIIFSTCSLLHILQSHMSIYKTQNNYHKRPRILWNIPMFHNIRVSISSFITPDNYGIGPEVDSIVCEQFIFHWENTSFSIHVLWNIFYNLSQLKCTGTIHEVYYFRSNCQFEIYTTSSCVKLSTLTGFE